jgi:hypothetical protein
VAENARVLLVPGGFASNSVFALNGFAGATAGWLASTGNSHVYWEAGDADDYDEVQCGTAVLVDTVGIDLDDDDAEYDYAVFCSSYLGNDFHDTCAAAFAWALPRFSTQYEEVVPPDFESLPTGFCENLM